MRTLQQDILPGGLPGLDAIDAIRAACENSGLSLCVRASRSLPFVLLVSQSSIELNHGEPVFRTSLAVSNIPIIILISSPRRPTLFSLYFRPWGTNMYSALTLVQDVVGLFLDDPLPALYELNLDDTTGLDVMYSGTRVSTEVGLVGVAYSLEARSHRRQPWDFTSFASNASNARRCGSFLTYILSPLPVVHSSRALFSGKRMRSKF